MATSFDFRRANVQIPIRGLDIDCHFPNAKGFTTHKLAEVSYDIVFNDHSPTDWTVFFRYWVGGSQTPNIGRIDGPLPDGDPILQGMKWRDFLRYLKTAETYKDLPPLIPRIFAAQYTDNGSWKVDYCTEGKSFVDQGH